MKRFIAIMAAAALALGLAACGGTDTPPPATQPTTEQAGNQAGGQPANEQNHSFVFRGTAITMGANPHPVLAELGEALNEAREPNCAIEGEDVSLQYPGIIVTLTYPADGGAPFLTGVRLTDDSVATPEGLMIGSPAADITRLYGQYDREENGFFTFNRGRSALEIAVGPDGLVNQIIYQYLFLGG